MVSTFLVRERETDDGAAFQVTEPGESSGVSVTSGQGAKPYNLSV